MPKQLRYCGGNKHFPRFAWHRPRPRTNLQFDAWLWMTAKMGRLDGILKDHRAQPWDEIEFLWL
jgi:hypothetical protein